MSFLRDQMDAFLEIARENIRRDGSLQPIAFGFKGEEMDIMVLEWKTLKQKRRVQRTVRRFIKRIGADAAVVVSEAWIKTAGPSFDPTKSIANDPESHEVIMVAGASVEERLCMVLPFEKTADGSYAFGEIMTRGDAAGESMSDEWFGGCKFGGSG